MAKKGAMAVKQSKEREGVGAGAEVEEASVKPVAENDRPWTVGSWRGMTQWRCGLCPWDTLEGEEAMREHIRVRHTPPKPRRSVLVANRYGKEVNE